ncbi:YidC/Oxa1 family membrane protein insertase [Povalibacter sp.]|uniref:YidC/Oxa1 family membrane protein insertase n=1 Tax=Povalibacter sp. TaxID=1962978 RepID=UPI002F417C24
MLIYASVFSLLPNSLGMGGKLIAFSVVLNVLLLPVYRQMERAFQCSRGVKERVAQEVARMRRHFRGRERYFYIRAVYRQYRYHPISELLRSVDLVVQILVFATVYRYLSGLQTLSGASFGPIRDLSAPDGLLGGINVLPLLMTAINVVAVMTYVSDRGKRILGISLAAIFLALLYNSASGLVLYWTMNNLFSVLRNVVEQRLVPRLPPPVLQRFAQISAQR